MTTTYGWHQLYEAAVLETDWSQMEERIRAAECAIRERLHGVSQNQGGTPRRRGTSGIYNIVDDDPTEPINSSAKYPIAHCGFAVFHNSSK
jgi:hypothetical protein